MNNRRRLTGVVAKNKMEKTVIVEVSRSFRHPLYKKVIHKTKRFLAHDEKKCQVGDSVQIVESRPISKHKRWIVEKILSSPESGQEIPVVDEVQQNDPA